MATPDDLIEIQRSGRRCAVCHTGRNWRQFEVVRRDREPPVVACRACHSRFGDAPPVSAPPPPAAAPTPAMPQPDPPAAKKRQAPREDRLRRALRELPAGEHSVGRIAKAAGLNHAKALGRLHALQSAGEVHQVGNRWSNEPPSTDLDAAFDRLKAKTRNLRIVTDRRADD